jgi:hypothetical protein
VGADAFGERVGIDAWSVSARRDGVKARAARRALRRSRGCQPDGENVESRDMQGAASPPATVRIIFGLRTRDLLSGYRELCRRFVDRAPLLGVGFEIEAELSLQAMRYHLTVAEVPIAYRVISCALSLSGGAVVVVEFVRSGLVPRLPLAGLSAALFLLGALSLACGVLLSSINRRTAEPAVLHTRGS